MRTIGKGIVKTDLNYLSACVALIGSGFFVTLATFAVNYYGFRLKCLAPKPIRFVKFSG